MGGSSDSDDDKKKKKRKHEESSSDSDSSDEKDKKSKKSKKEKKPKKVQLRPRNPPPRLLCLASCPTQSPLHALRHRASRLLSNCFPARCHALALVPRRKEVGEGVRRGSS